MPAQQGRLTRVLTIDVDELVIDGGRIRLKVSGRSSRKVAVQMIVDPSIKVEQRKTEAPAAANVAV